MGTSPLRIRACYGHHAAILRGGVGRKARPLTRPVDARLQLSSSKSGRALDATPATTNANAWCLTLNVIRIATGAIAGARIPLNVAVGRVGNVELGRGTTLAADPRGAVPARGRFHIAASPRTLGRAVPVSVSGKEKGSPPFSRPLSTECTVPSCNSMPFFCCREAASRNFMRTVSSRSGGFGFVNESAPVTLVDQGSGRCP
jgi:hypothetical protein